MRIFPALVLWFSYVVHSASSSIPPKSYLMPLEKRAETPFYESTIEDTKTIEGAYDNLQKQIKEKLFVTTLECLLPTSLLSKTQGKGSICPKRDKILADAMRDTLRGLSKRIPKLRSGIAALPDSSGSVSRATFNKAFMDLSISLSNALREVEKQACVILADTNSLSYDAFYGGLKTPSDILPIRSIFDSFLQTMNAYIQKPEAFDLVAGDINEDTFERMERTRKLFKTLSEIKSVEAISSGSERCVTLLAELSAEGLAKMIGGAVDGG